MSRRKREIRAAFEGGWDSACSLYRHLAAGGRFRANPNSDLVLPRGEGMYADFDLEYARYYAVNVSVTYSEPVPRFTISPTRLISDALDKAQARREFDRAKREVDEMSAPAWRDRCLARSVLTDRRLLCEVAGEWLSFWYSAIIQLAVDLPAWSFQLGFESTAPLMLSGPDAPVYALGVTYLTRGRAALRMPEFAPLADQSPMPPF
jgi:hypothetical protein